MEELRNIFASSCVEAAARKEGCSTGEMYRRMKRVGLIHGFILPGYEVLHTQSREHVTEDVLGALTIWESSFGSTSSKLLSSPSTKEASTET